MLIHDLRAIGEKMFYYRKKAGLTQAEVAELAGLSDRTYADIERGGVNMRVQTLLQICKSLRVMPDDILTEQRDEVSADDLLKRIDRLSDKEKRVALKLISAFEELG